MCPLRNIGTAIVFLVAVDAASLCAWTSDVTWTQDFGVNQCKSEGGAVELWLLWCSQGSKPFQAYSCDMGTLCEQILWHVVSN